VRRLDQRHYPRGFLAVLDDAPAVPWLYTGALENHPDLVTRVPRPLLGSAADTLHRVRDPSLVTQVLRQHSLPCPEVCGSAPDPRRRWLIKPLRGAGGAHIRAWKPPAPASKRPRGRTPRRFLQEWIDGPSYAAAFLGSNDGAELLGVTRQLVGEAWLHAGPFQYCGSIGPVQLADAVQKTLGRLGKVLAAEFSLRGLFGVDFILHEGEPWPVEVNPRYTASVEVLERATGRPFLADHASVFGVAGAGIRSAADRRIHGKAILFAARDTIWPARGPWEAALAQGLGDLSVPFADIPHAGTRIDSGQPICTLFAADQTEAACLAALRQQAATLERCLCV
jgi:uncharacterized protein